MSLLIIGGTGTLGRQIVLQALTKGYQVRCLVRNLKKANFLKEWGAELVYGDLMKPETISPCLKGISAIIDASTSRPNEFNSLKHVDWEGKLYLLKAAKMANIKRFIFFSVENVEKLQTIPLMRVKYKIERKLEQSNLPYTIFRLTGFYQGLIEQYAIPILEELPIWVTNDNNKISYMDTQDIAKFSLRSLQLPRTINKTFVLNNLKGWISSEIINLCEQLAGQSAKVQQIPSIVLKFISIVSEFFEWSENISDRLAFIEITNIKTSFSNSSSDLYDLFKIDSEEIIKLDDYFLDYFIRLLKRLRDINFEDIQKQKNLII